MNQDMLARRIAGVRMRLADPCETHGSALQRELAPETLEELCSALEELQAVTEALHQEHEQVLALRAVDEQLRARVRQEAAVADLGQLALADSNPSMLMND